MPQQLSLLPLPLPPLLLLLLQSKPRGHEGTARPSLRGRSPSHKNAAQVCVGAAQATRVQPQTARAQPKPRGHSPSLQGRSPSHEGSACLSLQGHSPSHSFPRITKIRLNIVVIVDLLLPLLATLPGQTLCARGSIGRPRPCLDVRPSQRIAVATATAAVFVLAVATTSKTQATRAQPMSARAQPKPQGLSLPESARA